APHASIQTKEIAQVVDLIVIPTGQSVDDLEPAVLLAHDLFKSGIPIKNIVFALMKVTGSESEIQSAREYLASTPYQVLNGAIPTKTSYSQALDVGKSINEVSFKGLHNKADELAQSIIDAVAELV
ncbi:MAG: ParA family protein, partial [Xanthomonadales bacterium]|nr:ParA family protein [Xanthomonadales bacterium]